MSQYIKELMQKSWFQKIFFIDKNEYRLNKHISDKEVINAFSFMTNEDKQYIKLSFIIGHINVMPSEKRLNIFNKYLDFSSSSPEEKAKIISCCFLSGREKVFKRSLQLFLDKQVIDILPKTIYNDATAYYRKNDISGNCKVLKNSLCGEDFTKFTPYLEEVILHPMQTNVNSIFTQTLNFSGSKGFKLREKFTELTNGTLNNINYSNPDFYDFYKNQSLSIITLNRILPFAKNDITPFLDFLKSVNILDQLFQPEYDNILYEAFIIDNRAYATHIQKRSVDNYMKIIGHKDNPSFFDSITRVLNKNGYMTTLKNYNKSDDFIMYFKESIVKEFDRRIKHSKLNVGEWINKPYSQIIEEYSLVREKDIILQSIPDNLTHNRIKSRI